jgi:phage terminase small subunit
MKRKLTIFQKKFADNIISGKFSTAKDAYEDVYKARGYTARVNASRLLTNANVAEYIEKQNTKLTFKAELSGERVLREEQCLAYSDVGEIFKGETTIRPDQLPEEVRRAIAGIEIKETEIAGVKTVHYKYKFWDKGRALERLEKHLGLFERDNAQRRLTLEEIIAALPDGFRDGVRTAINQLLSNRGDSTSTQIR